MEEAGARGPNCILRQHDDDDDNDDDDDDDDVDDNDDDEDNDVFSPGVCKS